MRRWWWVIGTLMVLVAGLITSRTAEANLLCKWFGRCLYESPGFRITVVDKLTGEALADVHGLAEWQSYAVGRRDGPLMVQDAVSGPDGVLVFPPWGPIHGYREGLVLNNDPVISLFKPGYRVLIINNAIPTDADETDRVRGLQQDGQRFLLEPFRGTQDDWVEQLKKVWRGLAFPRDDDETRQFVGPYTNRLKRVWAERDKVPEPHRSRPGFFWSVEEEMRLLQEGRR